MVSEQSVRKQLKEIGFKQFGWGKGEVSQLPHILLPDEKIFECVNGLYEGGFALLVATDIRVLLIDKKPLNFLTVEDLRFDMINEIDYSHRLMGAYITISSGDKTLRFRSYNQTKLRELITDVQHRMAEIKKNQHSHQEGQNQHLEQINQQLQTYLVAQQQHQEKLYEHLRTQGTAGTAAASVVAPPPIEPVKPSPELADYLFAQSLLAQHQAQTGQTVTVGQATSQALAPTASATTPPTQVAAPTAVEPVPATTFANPAQPAADEIYAEGMREVFGRHLPNINLPSIPHPTLEINNPLRIAYSKLPMVLRNRRFSQQAASWPRATAEAEPTA